MLKSPNIKYLKHLKFDISYFNSDEITEHSPFADFIPKIGTFELFGFADQLGLNLSTHLADVNAESILLSSGINL